MSHFLSAFSDLHGWLCCSWWQKRLTKINAPWFKIFDLCLSLYVWQVLFWPHSFVWLPADKWNFWWTSRSQAKFVFVPHNYKKYFNPTFKIITEVIASIMFQKIPKGAQKEWTVASQKDLKPKNKFKNIYPCKQVHTVYCCFVSHIANDSVSLSASQN